MSRARFDPGLQPERTALAWRRTVLAVGAAALVGVRLLPPALGVRGLAAALAGLVATVLAVLAERRARRRDVALAEARRPLPGGGLLLGLAVLVTAAALLGTTVLLVGLTEPRAGR